VPSSESVDQTNDGCFSSVFVPCEWCSGNTVLISIRVFVIQSYLRIVFVFLLYITHISIDIFSIFHYYTLLLLLFITID